MANDGIIEAVGGGGLRTQSIGGCKSEAEARCMRIKPEARLTQAPQSNRIHFPGFLVTKILYIYRQRWGSPQMIDRYHSDG